MAASRWRRKKRRRRRSSPNLRGEASALDGERIGSSQDEYEQIDWSTVRGVPGECRLSVSAAVVARPPRRAGEVRRAGEGGNHCITKQAPAGAPSEPGATSGRTRDRLLSRF